MPGRQSISHEHGNNSWQRWRPCTYQGNAMAQARRCGVGSCNRVEVDEGGNITLATTTEVKFHD